MPKYAKEYRSMSVRAGTQKTSEGIVKILEGRAIVFDTPTPIFLDRDGNQWFEQIHNDALEGVDLSNVVLKYNHSRHVPPLASTKADTLDLIVDSRGMGVTARMANTTQASDIYELVRSGILDKMSFAFVVNSGSDNWDLKTKTRTIFKFDKIYDVSVVDFPAYDDTTITARNIIKAQQELRDREREHLLLRLKTMLPPASSNITGQRSAGGSQGSLESQRQRLILKTML